MSFMNKSALLSAIAVLLLFCGNSVPFQDEAFLRRPVGISVTAVSPLNFQRQYFVQNLEKSFLGYNVYIARNTIGDSEVGGTIPALLIDGQLPTLKHSISDFNVDTAQTVTIERFNDSVTKFEEGITYFFRITAYSRQPLESLPSNVVSATAIP